MEQPPPPPPPSPPDLGNAVLYQHQVAQVVSAAALDPAAVPPWFAPAQLQLNAILRQLNTIVANQVRLETMACRTSNYTRLDGRKQPFAIMPFLDGSNPTAPPHNLPPLRSLPIIDDLPAGQLRAYLEGYGLQVPHLVEARRRALKNHIGCCEL